MFQRNGGFFLMVASRGRPSRLLPEAQKILSEYSIPITIRQLFYRLVSAGKLKNSSNSYTTLIQAMITARREGKVPFSVFEDRTRHSFLGEPPNPDFESAEGILNSTIYVFENAKAIALEQMKQASCRFDLPLWHNQPCYVEVWLEKEALANLFEPIAEKYGATFVPCRGYPSLSLLYECSKRLSHVPADREIRILYFGDYDMRGLNIQENIEQNLLNDFSIHAKVIRYALTKEQIEQFQLPPNPAKITDTMAKGWIEKNGDVAWELDALEPKTLVNILEEAIVEQIDEGILDSRSQFIDENRDWIAQSVKNYLLEHEEAS
jgi:hypothetical protein